MSRDIHPIILCSVMSVGELVLLKLTISLILYPFLRLSGSLVLYIDNSWIKIQSRDELGPWRRICTWNITLIVSAFDFTSL